MFPKSVSEGLFSFRDGAICPAMSIWMELDEDGSLANCGILCSNIKPTRLTYDAVCDRLEADESNNADLRRLYEVITSVTSRDQDSLHDKRLVQSVFSPGCQLI